MPSPKPKPAAAAAPAVQTAKRGKFVTVACKIPTGLVLQLNKKTTYFEDTPGGARERVRFDRTGPRHVARGTAYPALPPVGFPPRVPMVGGYALTPGIPADFWDQWIEQFADADFVKNKMIFAFHDLSDVRAECKENAHVLSGLEPLVPDNDPRSPKGIPGMSGIETEDQMKARMAAPQIDEAETALAE